MRPVPDNAFERFVVQRKKDLQRIARHTGGEHQLTDVLHEAWIMAANLQAPNGTHLDLENAACQEKLLSHLYQHLVRYTEQNVRRAIRLDHAAPGHDLDDDVHPLTYLLISDEGQDPLGELIERETTSALDADLDAHGSLAAAYVHLLRHFDNRMSAVANHLLISRSYAYHCCAKARQLAAHLQHIPIPVSNESRVPGPWRSFRLRRIPVQLSFDFDDELLFKSAC
ncbi:hypothetical protein [Ralstonia pseudosolanacearum]|uniref:hypothetical protein n=1 Tax=Ralstonia pseudosolanacearum TaxID=1310165 RepID=UPI0018D0844B|nr:hypothetical protein [Ralstonia pseudosolanacearum]